MESYLYYDNPDVECYCYESESESEDTESTDDNSDYSENESTDCVNLENNKDITKKDKKCNCGAYIEFDSAGKIPYTELTDDVMPLCKMTKFNQIIKKKSYFVTENSLKLGDIVWAHRNGNTNAVVIGWSKDKVLLLPTNRRYQGHHYAIESNYDFEYIRGNIDIKGLFTDLCTTIDKHFPKIKTRNGIILKN